MIIFEVETSFMKNIFFVLFFFSLFTNCKEEKKFISNVNSVLSSDNVESSFFLVDCTKDTIIIGVKGTRITLTENTFANSKGEIVSGSIQLEIKECIAKEDIVLANLYTMSNGQILESGGMIYLNAKQDGEQLSIANDKQIGVEVLADSSLIGMSYYEGELVEDSTINWRNPIMIEPNVPKEITETIKDSVKTRRIKDTIHKRCNIAFNANNQNDSKKNYGLSDEEYEIITEKIFRQNLTITKDSVFTFGKHTIYLYKQDTIRYWKTYTYEDIWVPIESVNTYMEDPNTNYIFSVKKLGWANIDRLYQDERTKNVEFITEVQDYVKFDKIFISMIFKEKNIFLPGYQRMDKTFGFSHGDFEDMNLPLGETVQILATSNKDGESFYSLESIIINEKTNVTMNMTKITKEDLKVKLLKM